MCIRDRYVDDGAIAGPRDVVLAELNLIGQEVVFKPPTALQRFLGVQLHRTLKQEVPGMILEQRAYAEHAIAAFEAEWGQQPRAQAIPGLSLKQAEDQHGQRREGGRFAHTARTHLGALLYLARATRPDLAEAVASLAREVTQWGPACDARLQRIFGYLRRTAASGLLSQWASASADDASRVVAAVAGVRSDATSALQRAMAGQVRGFLHTFTLKAYADSDHAVSYTHLTLPTICSV